MAQPPEITTQPYVGPHSPPLNLHQASNDLGRGAQPVVAPHLQPVNLQHTSNILGGGEPFVGPNSQPINRQDTCNIQEGGAQPFVTINMQASNLTLNLQASNLQDTNNIIQGGEQPTNLQDPSNIQGGSDAPLMTTAASATQAPQVIMTGRERNYYRPLYLAARRGDWERAKSFIDGDPKALTARITDKFDTVLLVAAKSCRWEFVLKFLELLSPESIAMQDTFGNTALHYVAQAGTLRTAKALVERNDHLLHMVTGSGVHHSHLTPLHYSILAANKELVWYFSLMDRVEYSSLPKTLCYLNQTGLFDVSLYFIRQYPELALDKKTQLLFSLAAQPSCFFSGSNLGFFERWIYKFVPVNMEDTPGSIEGSAAVQPRSFVVQASQLLWKAMAQLAPSIKVIRDMKLKHECAVELVILACKELSPMSLEQINDFLTDPHLIMCTAVANGIEEIVSILLQYFPDLLSSRLMPERNILQAAIEYRQEKIVNILKEIFPIATKNFCKSVRESKNTTLHLAGKSAPPFKILSISGAALQMQRELQWFKEVEKITPPYQREQKNSNNETAKEVFWEAHKGLAVEAEKWMKDTANSCMLVSTLIATVLFAAAFTVPGGNVGDKGTPIFLWADAFMLFAISDAIGLFSSLTCLLMFLAILTARYAVDDFLESLPKKLIIGLGSLFLAIAAMIIAFGASLTIILSERWQWVTVPIVLLAIFPVAIFVMLQLPLFIQMVKSTYGSSIFHPFPSRDFE